MHTQPSAILLILSMASLFALKPQSTAAADPFDSRAIDRFIAAQMAAQRVPGLALAITHGDEVLYVKGYGTAGNGRPVTPETQFLIASVSKSFTALAVLQLVEAGKLDLDAPVQTYLPTFTHADPALARQITIRQLLHQTSGLADAGFPELRLPPPETTQERIASLRTARPVAPPGSEFHYFNPNYQILARVVEVVSGQPFSAYLQAHIFAPLRMAQTANVITSLEIRHRAAALAQGHLLAFGVPLASVEETGFLGGSGGVISTAQDMARYLVIHTNGGHAHGATLLSPQGMAELHTPPANSDGNYAMGWFEQSAQGTRILEHNGILSTFSAEAVLLPETGYGIALLSNVHSVTHDALGLPRIKHGLIALLTGSQPTASRWSAGAVELVLGVITVLSIALELRGLLRLRQWAKRASFTPLLRLLPGIAWLFVPAALVLAMPAIVLSASGRAFGYLSLFRSMLGIMLWLGTCGVLGGLNGITRIAVLLRLWWVTTIARTGVASLGDEVPAGNTPRTQR